LLLPILPKDLKITCTWRGCTEFLCRWSSACEWLQVCAHAGVCCYWVPALTVCCFLTWVTKTTQSTAATKTTLP